MTYKCNLNEKIWFRVIGSVVKGNLKSPSA